MTPRYEILMRRPANLSIASILGQRFRGGKVGGGRGELKALGEV